MQDLIHKKIIIAVTGSIAAYKSVYLVRELVALGAEVRVIMTDAAQEFITPLTLQVVSGHPVRISLLDTAAEQAMSHIELARFADYLVIAPASAHSIAKLAQGLADDLLTTVYLATSAPVLVCPAMNKHMWHHPATQEHIRLLQERGVVCVGPEEGEQACKDVGLGRFSDPINIIHTLRLFPVIGLLQGKSVLISAGPTEEALDPVRFISNRSSGKMGYALAMACQLAGAKVTLISGPCHLPIPPQVYFQQVVSAKEMQAAVMQALEPGMIVIGCAAVGDFSVAGIATEKIKKTHQPLTLHLTPNPDILTAVVQSQKAAFVIGFALETEKLLEYAQTKLLQKNLDMIIANQLSPYTGFGTEENAVTVITREQQVVLPLTHKMCLAGQIVALFAPLLP